MKNLSICNSTTEKNMHQKKKKTGLVADTWVLNCNDVEVFTQALILGSQQFKNLKKNQEHNLNGSPNKKSKVYLPLTTSDVTEIHKCSTICISVHHQL